MFRVEFIGNLAADAELKSYNGANFISFRVAHTDRQIDADTGAVTSERTTWASCTLNGDNANLRPILTRGQKVFIRGRAYLSTYDSKTAHGKVAGLDVRVSEIELCGASKDDREAVQNWKQANEYILSLGYTNWNEIPHKNET